MHNWLQELNEVNTKRRHYLCSQSHSHRDRSYSRSSYQSSYRSRSRERSHSLRRSVASSGYSRKTHSISTDADSERSVSKEKSVLQDVSPISFDIAQARLDWGWMGLLHLNCQC